MDPLHGILNSNVEHAKRQLAAYRRAIASAEPQPHLEEEEDPLGEDPLGEDALGGKGGSTHASASSKKRKAADAAGQRATKEKKKTKAAATPVEGPCEGRIWLGSSEGCPGAQAQRGKNPERDAGLFARAVYVKKRHVFCVSCKREYIKWRKEQKEQEQE